MAGKSRGGDLLFGRTAGVTKARQRENCRARASNDKATKSDDQIIGRRTGVKLHRSFLIESRQWALRVDYDRVQRRQRVIVYRNRLVLANDLVNYRRFRERPAAIAFRLRSALCFESRIALGHVSFAATAIASARS